MPKTSNVLKVTNSNASTNQSTNQSRLLHEDSNYLLLIYLSLSKSPNVNLLGDVSWDHFCPMGPQSLRKHIFNYIHSLGHQAYVSFIGQECEKIYNDSAEHVLHASYQKSLPFATAQFPICRPSNN